MPAPVPSASPALAAGGRGPAPTFLRTATSSRMLLLLLLLLGAAAVCARLGVWQLDRAQIRGDVRAAAEQAELVGAPAEPIAEVLAPQSGFPGDLVGHKVVATGTFDEDPLLVPGRALDGRTGYLLLDPLRVDDSGLDGGSDLGPGTDPVLPVVRGWVATPQEAQALEPVPAGPVQVTGYLQGGEAGGDGGLPEGQVDAVSPAELVNRWGGPIYSGYLVVTETEPAQDSRIALLPPPTVPGGGLNVQNLAYALQWWIFGGFALVLWVRMVRDETRVLAEELETDGPDADGPDADEPDADGPDADGPDADRPAPAQPDADGPAHAPAPVDHRVVAPIE